jgi:excisionase family DNA binding protein
MSLTEAALLLGRSRSWVHEQVRRGVIPGIRLGTRWWVRKADLIASGWLGEAR